jgi:NitT/TauT family transport system substrate-binding protein
LAIALLAVSACGDDDDDGDATATTTAQELVKLDFPSNSFRGATSILADVIKERGIDKKHGLDLTVKEYATTDQPQQAVAAGSIDVGHFTLLPWAQLKNEGREAPDLIWPINLENSAILVGADSPYRSLADLKGKKVAGLPAGSGQFQLMKILGKEAGLDWEKDVQHISGPPPTLVGFLETGEVEAANLITQGAIAQMLASGKFRVLLDLSDHWQQQTGSELFSFWLATRPGWADDHADEVQSLRAMMREALALVAGDAALVDKYQEELELNDAEWKLARGPLAEGWATGTPAEVERAGKAIVDKAVEAGLLTTAPSPVLKAA